MTTREDIAERQRARRGQTCKHWRGALAQPPCAAGVDLIALAGRRVTPEWGNRIPCLPNDPPAFICESKETPTPAEIGAERAAMAEAADATLTVMAAIPAGKPGDHGTLPCPKCGGAVRWGRSSYNGHLSALCESGCVNFMQ